MNAFKLKRAGRTCRLLRNYPTLRTVLLARLEKVLKVLEAACFVAGTPVWTKNGLRPIETIRAGDWVLSRDPQTGRQEYRRVLSTVVTHSTALYHIRYRRLRAREPRPLSHRTTRRRRQGQGDRDGESHGEGEDEEDDSAELVGEYRCILLSRFLQRNLLVKLPHLLHLRPLFPQRAPAEYHDASGG
ncbi:MAG: Hint domain-containing protein [Abditibacteriales bacterium]|nr:Hint domain-containing protein [Abditibacteriales bacterium]